jgi:L-seryl-tRNA(Ser) seleniumtransferase
VSEAQGDVAARLRGLPAVDAVLRRLPEGAGAGAGAGATAAARSALDRLREAVLAGTAPDPLPSTDALADELAAQVLAELAGQREAVYPRVVNATGVLLHTGLGRAPLAPAAAEAVAAAATGFTLLEVDDATGDRQHRESAAAVALLAVTGGEAATIVNNNAGALLLALAAIAGGREVLVSRGELIEIGGGFRLPELMALSGATLVEVGTTNRTYRADYADAITDHTAMILSVHTSNFKVVGFQHSAPRAELVELCKERGVPLLEDVGSGLLAPGAGSFAEEPDVASSLAAGVDLVCFSGDKLLGGPQAGILVGRTELVARCRRHAMFRALRPDRLCLSALAATLALHRHDPNGVPTAAVLAATPKSRLETARALAAQLGPRFPDARFDALITSGEAGSGSLPGKELRSAAVVVDWPGLEADELLLRLRTGRPSVFARVWKGRLQLDVLAMLPGDEDRIVAALEALA